MATIPDETVVGTLAEMKQWMKEAGVPQEKIDAFGKDAAIQARGRASNCTRSITGTCSQGGRDDCFEYTITCTSTDSDGNTYSDSTTVCRCG